MFNISGFQIRVIDLFNFLLMVLVKFFKVFQLESLVKGFFFYFFICQVNWNYVGFYLFVEIYGLNVMLIEGRKECYKWYEFKVSNGEVFDFQKEIIKYCWSDVDIFWCVCFKFKNLLFEVIGGDGGCIVDVFDFCIIVFFCMDVFKIKFLFEEWKFYIKKGDQEWWIEVQRCDNKIQVNDVDQWILWDDFKLCDVIIIKEEFFKFLIVCVLLKGYLFCIKYSCKLICWLE